MSEKPDLTVIIPTHRYDERFLAALKSTPWAKEVIVIDQNSGIDFEKLKPKFDFTVLPYPKLTSFSEMKNEAVKQVQTTWIFFLDSDEYISSKLADEVQEQILDSTADAFRVHRVDVFLAKKLFHGETRVAKFIRVVKMNNGKWVGDAHEEWQMSDNATKIEEIASPLFHEPHLSIHEFITKINLYTSVLAKEKNEKNVILRSVLFPKGKFLYTFVVKHGFLDGFRGLVYSFLMAIHSNAVRVKRYEQS